MVQVGKVSFNEEIAGLETGHSFSAVVYKYPDSGVNLWGGESNTKRFKTYVGNDNTCCFLVKIVKPRSQK